MVERFNEHGPRHPESAAEIIPDRDAEFVTGLDQTQECIAAITAVIAPRPGTDFAPGDLTADVVLGTICVERDLRPVQHHQQLRLIGVQPRQQAVQRGEASATAEDAVEPAPNTPRPTLP